MKRRMKLPLLLFLGFWGLAVLVMTWTYYMNPDPGTGRFGTTYRGELATMLVFTAVEVAVFLAILRPWSYERSRARAVSGLLLLTPWIVLSSLVGMHSGPTTAMHGGWLMFFWAGLVGAAIISGRAAWRARRTPAAPAA